MLYHGLISDADSRAPTKPKAPPDAEERHKAEIERLRAAAAAITAKNLELIKRSEVGGLLPEERTAICEFALRYPKIGYRKLTWMMVDAQVACASGKHGFAPLLSAQARRYETDTGVPSAASFRRMGWRST